MTDAKTDKELTPEEILEIDAKRNHPPGTTLDDLIDSINAELIEGGNVVRHKNVLIAYRTVAPGVVEHHSYNADNVQNLIEANKQLWRMLKKVGAEIAYTYYENPKINQLFETALDEFDISIAKTKDGFIAEVRL